MGGSGCGWSETREFRQRLLRPQPHRLGPNPYDACASFRELHPGGGRCAPRFGCNVKKHFQSPWPTFRELQPGGENPLGTLDLLRGDVGPRTNVGWERKHGYNFERSGLGRTAGGSRFPEGDGAASSHEAICCGSDTGSIYPDRGPGTQWLIYRSSRLSCRRSWPWAEAGDCWPSRIRPLRTPAGAGWWGTSGCE